MANNNEALRRERFRRVAARRTNKILETMRILGNCSNKSTYLYSDEEVQKIFSTIERELRLVRAKFVNRRKTTFKL